MASQGPLTVGTGADDAGIGTLAWNSPGNITASDSSYATASPGGASATTHYLKGTNCGFSIPAGATINGILVEINRHGSGSTAVQDNSVILTLASSQDKAAGGNWPTSDTRASYGGSSDLWGTSPTPTDINASTFGAKISATVASAQTALVNDIQITVTYTPFTNGQPSGQYQQTGVCGVVVQAEPPSTVYEE